MGDKRKMITVVVGKEIEKIKGDFESYLNGLNMVGEISYSQYSELYDEGTKQIQRAYELGKAELEKENAELEKDKDYFSDALDKQIDATLKLQKENEDAKNLIEELASSLSVVGECDEEECELIDKARKFINKPIF
jgi:hypothetical protein